MAHPVEPSFGRHGEYSTGRTAVEAFRQGSFTLPRNMYNGNGQQEPLNLWQKVTMRADAVRDAMGDKCCRCLHHMPSLVLIIGILLIIGLAIAAVPVAFVLISNAGQTAELKGDQLPEGGTVFHPIRHGLSAWPGYNEEMDSLEEQSELRAISADALFPPNVSLCHGFGFACTSQPSMVISTYARCDGKTDCADGSDELHCRECQTHFWCEMGRNAGAGAGAARERRCLRADQLCDGVVHCEDRADEVAFCRKSDADCPKDSRRCKGSPLCLPNASVCDGEPDCSEDDDEADCKECNRGAKMCAPTKRCIPRAQLCDGVVNCPDGSDEMDCDCKACSGWDRALCGNGRCLERSRICDGTIDCEGGIDEENCPGTCRALPAGKNASTTITAAVKTVKCADGRFYPESEACSGFVLACAHSCPNCDAKLAFACTDKSCIPKMQVCDGRADCAGGEDERGCDTMCAASRPNFKCASGSKCVPVAQRCDGVRDCEDGSDESDCKKCPSDALHCAADGRCLPAGARCDGVADCTDASDEADCSCQECTGAHSNTYSCETTPHCFRRESVCTPYSRCPNATHADKLFCAARAVHKNIF
ncbi:hypothetical protein PFISCL1PPCAC_22450 [Pristionchus fissidentatus]|uniref:Egg-1 n=1 Tax=Pristionchus fissidentatus TaxID=1538716 RepID=A0AAV5WLL4_9BILA|nr:hypothetical protein PFISCL1PPCAC_22450 [Pristionchus fissidentatus]